MRQKGLFFAGFCALIVLISGCSHLTTTTATYRVLPSGYSCFAANYKQGGYAGSAWARHLLHAQKRALERCRVHSRYPNACKIRSCRWVAGAPISENGYFTCYVKNNNRYGVWLSTSHNEYRAKDRAMYRCQRYSGQASSCYFDHCWLW